MSQEAVQPPREDPSEALMREVGAQLRAVRRERGEDLDEIAEYLRIRPVYLHGIERGDMSVMPGRTYALGFLRTYADYLGFDGEDLIEQIKSTVDDLTGKTRFHIRAPLHESRLPKMPLLVLSFAMLAGIYAGWTWLNRDDAGGFGELPPLPEQVAPVPEEEVSGTSPPEPASDRSSSGPGAASGEPAAGQSATSRSDQGVPEVPPSEVPPSGEAARSDGPAPEGAGMGEDRLAGLAPEAGPGEEADDSGPAGGRAEAARAPATAGAREGETAPLAAPDEVGALIAELRRSGGGAADDRPPVDGRQAGARLDPPADGPTSRDAPREAAAAVESVLEAAGNGQATVHETVNADARVIIRALGESWMQIRSTSGDYLRTRTLQPGDSFLVPNRDDLVLWTGNAGAIEYLVDGERIAPLGPEGQVIRGVPLEPSALLERAGRPE